MSVATVDTSKPDTPEAPAYETTAARYVRGSRIGLLSTTYADCVFCKSAVGKDIGGRFVGYHWKTPVVICDWCEMCIKDVLT